MNPYYNQNYTRKHIQSMLTIIHGCIKQNRYSISKNENRRENIDFINNYNLTSAKQKDILLIIKPEDFCHSLQNTKLGFEHEILYVFCPQVMLFNLNGEEEVVDIYIKFNMIEYDSGKRVIVISFHKRNKPVDYIFR